MNKKGVFFTLITIAIVTVFIVTVSIVQFERDDSITTRVSTMESFLSSLEKDLERRTYIFGIRSILAMESEILLTANYIDDLDATVEELFLNASIKGKVMENISTDITLNDTLQEVNYFADKFGVDVQLQHVNITMYQDDPWTVVVNWTANLTLSDESNLARWEKIASFIARIGIENFEDPLYIVGTNGSYTNIISKSPYEDTLANGTDVLNLSKHVNASYYIAYPNGSPNFLDRIVGSTTPDEFGIESMVNLLKLSQQGITTQSKSVVDHVYFSVNNPTDRTLKGMQSWFRIDDTGYSSAPDREDWYNVSDVPNN